MTDGSNGLIGLTISCDPALHVATDPVLFVIQLPGPDPAGDSNNRIEKEPSEQRSPYY